MRLLLMVFLFPLLIMPACRTEKTPDSNTISRKPCEFADACKPDDMRCDGYKAACLCTKDGKWKTDEICKEDHTCIQKESFAGCYMKVDLKDLLDDTDPDKNTKSE